MLTEFFFVWWLWTNFDFYHVNQTNRYCTNIMKKWIEEWQRLSSTTKSDGLRIKFVTISTYMTEYRIQCNRLFWMKLFYFSYFYVYENERKFFVSFWLTISNYWMFAFLFVLSFRSFDNNNFLRTCKIRS